MAMRVACITAATARPTKSPRCFELKASDFCCSLRRRQPAQRRHRLIRFRPAGVVGIGCRRPYCASPVNDEARGNRQCPGIVAVEARQVDSKFLVHASQVARQRKGQAESRCCLIATVGEEIKIEFQLVAHIFAEHFALRRDNHQGGPKSFDLRQCFV